MTINISQPADSDYESGYVHARLGKSEGANPNKALTTAWSSWNRGFAHGLRDKKIDQHRFGKRKVTEAIAIAAAKQSQQASENDSNTRG